MSVILIDDNCSRCGKLTKELFPYHLSTVYYRGKMVETPWLCYKCLKIEKRKAWQAVQVQEVWDG